MGAGKNEYRTFGGAYVILGVWLFFYSSLTFSDIHLLTSVWRIFPRESYFLVSFLYLFTFFGSLALVVFGVILVVHGVIWLVWVSSVLCIVLLGCYFLVLYYPLLVQA